MNHIRIDSCRNCGIELQVMRFCTTCEQPLHFDCTNCNVFVDDPIHQHDITSQPFLRYFGVNG